MRMLRVCMFFLLLCLTKQSGSEKEEKAKINPLTGRAKEFVNKIRLDSRFGGEEESETRA